MFLLQEDSSDGPSVAGNCRFNLLLVSLSVKNLTESTFQAYLNCIMDHSCSMATQVWAVKSPFESARAPHHSAVLMAAMVPCVLRPTPYFKSKFCCWRWAHIPVLAAGGLSGLQQPAGADCLALLIMWPGNHSSQPWLSSLLAPKNIGMTSPPQPGPKCNSTRAEN